MKGHGGFTLSCSLLLLFGTFVPALLKASERPSMRNFEVEDVLRLEGVGLYYGGAYSISDDGERVAVARAISRASATWHRWEDGLINNTRSDVWVQDSPEAPLTRITNGQADGSGWWAPQWSPDGRYLAMLSTQGGALRLWVWDSESRGLSVVDDRSIDIDTVGIERRPFEWLDSNRLIYPVLAKGRLPAVMYAEELASSKASSGWRDAAQGLISTASVLDSGVQDSGPSEGQLRIAEVSTKEILVVVEGTAASWSISPDGRKVAFTRVEATTRPEKDKKLQDRKSAQILGLGITVLTEKPFRTVSLGSNVIRESLRWSADSEHVAFLGYDIKEPNRKPNLYVADGQGEVEKYSGADSVNSKSSPYVDADLRWGPSGRILIRGVDEQADPAVSGTRSDWWSIDAAGTVIRITGELAEAPSSLFIDSDEQEALAVSGGKLWRIDLETTKAVEVRSPEGLEATAIVFYLKGEPPEQEHHRSADRILLSYRSVDGRMLSYVFGGDWNRPSLIVPPTHGAVLKAYARKSGSAVFEENTDRGLSAWRTSRIGGSVKLFSANEFLSSIRSGSFRKITYRSLSGKNLTAWLILPPNFEESKSYPMLTWVYGGWIAGGAPPESMKITADGMLNMQIAAAQGYVILLPSVPVGGDWESGNPMLQMTDGVLPAVDRVIEMGIAKKEQVFVIGHSFGGYSVLSLITQTDKFRAAIALAAESDLISSYGKFDARFRYSERPQDYLIMMGMAEFGQTGMGAPLWIERERYIRNSPVMFADRVNTPILMIHGDLDFVPVHGSEEFFSALYRQGKRARMIRYWGEGHTLQSPENIRSMWDEILSWLDEFSTDRTYE